jgi:hypothetical protein
MIKFKAWNASNSRAIAKFHNTEIGHFGHNAFIHELIRGSLINQSSNLSWIIDSSTIGGVKLLADFLAISSNFRSKLFLGKINSS